MNKKINSITLSLSGVCQSVYLIQQLAQLGKCDKNAFKICVESILKINSESVITIYGNDEKNLSIGLKILLSILTFSNLSYSYITLIKYIFHMIILEDKLKKNHLAIYALKKQILHISEEYSINCDINFLTTKLEQLYLDVISNLGSRIKVTGTKIFLKNFKIQEKIRCLLFSGIRSICLWKQFGGSQLQLIFFRYYIIKKIRKILYNLNKNT